MAAALLIRPVWRATTRASYLLPLLLLSTYSFSFYSSLPLLITKPNYVYAYFRRLMNLQTQLALTTRPCVLAFWHGITASLTARAPWAEGEEGGRQEETRGGREDPQLLRCHASCACCSPQQLQAKSSRLLDDVLAAAVPSMGANFTAATSQTSLERIDVYSAL